MALKESKSDNNILAINNIIDSFTQDFRKCYNSMKFYKKPSSKKKYNYKKEKGEYKQRNDSKSSKSIILDEKSKTKRLNKNSTPIEFFYEFQDFVQGGDPKKKNEIQNLKQMALTERKNKKTKKSSKNKKKTKIVTDYFWEKVKYYIELKNERLNELTYRIKLQNLENKNESKSSPRLNKSPFLINNTKRKPLYQYKNINEDLLSRNFDNFYSLYQKELKYSNINNKLHKKKKNIYDSSKKINTSFNINEKYKKFYDKNIDWKRQRDNKINIERNIKEETNKLIINSFSFKPYINKKSIQLVKKRNDFINFMENKPKTDRNYHNLEINKKEIYQKYLTIISPYMSFYYEKHSPFYKKNNLSFTKRKKSFVDIGMIHINKGKNIKIIKEKVNNNSNSEKSLEKNNKTVINKKSIFNIFKPDKKNLKKNNNRNEEIKKNLEKDKINDKKNKIRQKIWWSIIKDKNFNKPNNDGKKYDFNDLYKVNVRDNSSWNKICINKIIPLPKDKNILNDLL